MGFDLPERYLDRDFGLTFLACEHKVDRARAFRFVFF